MSHPSLGHLSCLSPSPSVLHWNEGRVYTLIKISFHSSVSPSLKLWLHYRRFLFSFVGRQHVANRRLPPSLQMLRSVIAVSPPTQFRRRKVLTLFSPIVHARLFRIGSDSGPNSLRWPGTRVILLTFDLGAKQ